MPSHVLAAVFFERYVRYFGSLHPAFGMSCDTEYIEKSSFWFFRKRGRRHFGLCAIVLMIFLQAVRKIMGDLTKRKTPTLQNDVEYLPKISVRALLCFFIVVTKKYVLRTSWGLSTWNNTCFSFNCRVTFWLRYLSPNATFGTSALYILRLRWLAIPNTYKNSFWFFWKRGLRRFVLCAIVLMIFVQTFRKILGDLTERKTSTFQNDVEYVPKMSVWALLCFFLWF